MRSYVDDACGSVGAITAAADGDGDLGTECDEYSEDVGGITGVVLELTG